MIHPLSRFRVLNAVALGAALATTPAPARAEPRAVTDAEGRTVNVPRAPKRIVTLGEIDLDSSLALGLKPVGAINGRGQGALPHYLTTSSSGPDLNGMAVVGDLGRPNVEAILKLKPDLVLTPSLRPELLTLLGKVAPTVVTSKADEDWKATFERVARVLGRDAEAAAFMTGYAGEVEAAKAKLAAHRDKTVSIVRWNPKGPAFMYRDAFASLVLRDLGFDRPEPQRVAGVRHSMPLGLESLGTIDAGFLFVGALDPKGEAAEAQREMAESAPFGRLAAVKAKRSFTVDGSKWTSIGGPLAARSIVGEATALMAGAPN